jgi:hypothetical protein
VNYTPFVYMLQYIVQTNGCFCFCLISSVRIEVLYTVDRRPLPFSFVVFCERQSKVALQMETYWDWLGRGSGRGQWARRSAPIYLHTMQCSSSSYRLYPILYVYLCFTPVFGTAFKRTLTRKKCVK